MEEVEKGGEHVADRVVPTCDRILRGDMAVRGVSEQQDVGEHRHRGRWRGQQRRWRRGRGRPDVDGLRERSVAPPAEPSSTSSSNAGRVLRAEQRRSPSQR